MTFVRRLRAKLGDMESLIGTVRNVGYRFTVAEASDEVKEKEPSASDATTSTSGA